MTHPSLRHLSVVALLTLSMGALADPPAGKGHGKVHSDNPATDSESLIHASISVTEARRIALEYRQTGYTALPPGIRKNLARGKPLPPGIARKMVPSPVLTRLPRYEGYEWSVAGSDLVLIAIATGVIADVLIDVFS